MLKYSLDDLRAAARNNDARSREMGFVSYLQSIGIEPDDLLHTAEQRALRAIILFTRGEAAMIEMFKEDGRPYGTPLDISATEKDLLGLAQASFIDGFMAGFILREGTALPLPKGRCERCRQPRGGTRRCQACGYRNPK